jgi:hypothetical protein
MWLEPKMPRSTAYTDEVRTSHPEHFTNEPGGNSPPQLVPYLGESEL